ncbi:hypothetical protein [Paenibacillus sp. Marseille-Q4541]|uniref:hypothetical protein n=1 Tax=Paenibacillus sp. Marseille-Q4541 TaxID=2831522 RepID=UPI001BABA8FA|nr:hypothetical protein [Paenibacillus sp. Marseille-Q4541]
MKKGITAILATFLCAVLLLDTGTAEAQEVKNENKVETHVMASSKFDGGNSSLELAISAEEEQRLRDIYDLDMPEPKKPEFTSDWGMIYGDIMIGSGEPAFKLGPNAPKDLIKLVMYILTIAFM